MLIKKLLEKYLENFIMNLTEFMGLLNGEYKETAGTTAKNQCVDLANAYIRYVLRLPIIEWTNAVDFPSKASDNYEYILNTPNGIPQEGDLVIWGGNQYGHIAIFIEGDTNTFRSFDENYPTGSPCHVQEHNYDSPKVLGWLRVKSAIITPPTTQELTDQTIIPAILLGQSLPLEIQQIRGLLGDFRRCREELNTVEEDKENLIGQLKGS